MSQPSAYVPQHSFVADSAVLPNFPGQAIDVELQSIKTTTDAVGANLKLIQRDDGALANGTVGYDALSPTLQTNGLATAAAWITANAYQVGTTVYQNSNLYRCLVAHTSGVFATDLAAGDWLLLVALPPGPTGPAGTITVHSTTTLAAGSPATVVNVGTATAASLDFGIPQGSIGNTGPAAWSAPAAWLTTTVYAAGPPASVVVQGGETYVCLISHTAGVFATDLAAAKWIKVAQKGTGDLLSTNNLSDVTIPATARTNLGLAIGTNVQAFDAQLSSTIPQNSKSAAYTTVLTDGQKHIFHPSADTTARSFTIDSNANVAYPIGTAITFINQHSAGVLTIAITTDTMRLAGAGTTGSRTLAADGIATAVKVTATEWIISGTGLT